MELNEERSTNSMKFIQQIKSLPFVERVLDVRGMPDGFTVFFRAQDGNAYEIQMRPASRAHGHDEIRKAGSYAERKKKQQDKMRKEMGL